MAAQEHQAGSEKKMIRQQRAEGRNHGPDTKEKGAQILNHMFCALICL
jgi:hypothetical protein